MFTGLVKEVGKVVSVKRERGNLKLTIEAKSVSDGVRSGDSVCVNGVCLTVTDAGSTFEAEVSPETLSRTNLQNLRAGSEVNLESPLTPSSALGGHFVTGHVDATAKIRSIKRQSGSQVWEMEIPKALGKYIVEKGSVCVDGVSLTVASLKPGAFTVALIPHTLEATTFKEKRPGNKVNIEADIMAKHIEKLMARR